MKKKLLFLVALLVLVLACVGTALAVNTDMVVGEGELNYITTINGHVVEPGWKVYRMWSCTQEGIAYFRCLQGEGGIHYHYIGVKPSGHTWSDQIPYDAEKFWGNIPVDQKPSCTNLGLAKVVCTKCGAVREGSERYVNMLQHTYKVQWYLNANGDKVLLLPQTPSNAYEVAYAYQPTCAKTGRGYAKCVDCGYVWMPKDGGEVYIIPTKAHDWTDWTKEYDGDCWKYGKAVRACILCGAHQILNEETWVTDFGAGLTADNATKEYWRLNGSWFNAPLRRKNWNPDNPWSTTNEYQFSKISTMEDLGYEWAYVVDRVHSCYIRTAHIKCPYCNGKYHANQKNVTLDSKKNQTTKITEKYGIVAHQWAAKAKFHYPVSDFYTWDAKKKVNVLKKFTLDVAKLGSMPATCTEDGYELWACVYDNDAAAWPVFQNYAPKTDSTSDWHADEPVATRFKKVTIKATGHNWQAWETLERYTKNGEQWILLVRKCSKCYGTEEKVLKAGEATVDTIKLNKHAITLKIKDTDLEPSYTLVAKVQPAGIPIFWASSNEDVATVEDGKVVGLKKGTVTITATSADGVVVDKCTVKVKDKRKNK